MYLFLSLIGKKPKYTLQAIVQPLRNSLESTTAPRSDGLHVNLLDLPNSQMPGDSYSQNRHYQSAVAPNASGELSRWRFYFFHTLSKFCMSIEFPKKELWYKSIRLIIRLINYGIRVMV